MNLTNSTPRISLARRAKLLVLYCLFLTLAKPLYASDFSDVIKAIKPSVVAIGSVQKTRSPAISFKGTGFAVGDGLTIITNAHVINTPLNAAEQETLGVLIERKGDTPEFRTAVITAVDEEHDLARLTIGGTPLPALTLGDISQVDEGQSIAFTGFPLGIVLGFQHVTHQGIISALTPIVRPALTALQLNPKMAAQLRRTPFIVLQLDATAYPGNSGSPLFDPQNGKVLGVINMVFVKGLKEAAITNPSGISYAIPVNYVSDILKLKVP
ncbi:S1 family peptidase [Solimicrobium silvestre]|uniref:Trypsin-like peptidase domain n=1 Tax=Solimicrobium silvestre TaxID=2099400 RepID=A0A2S9H0L7_9BURK|nr:serine protease [Solimicrobium silvestre]PRC93521.1 Trypsin-like peptidase domain [Solimicrobium silvestre]